MLNIDNIGKDSLSEIKTGKADFSAQLHGENLLGISFPFNNIKKQVGALHLCFPIRENDGPELCIDASNADKDNGRVLKFSLNKLYGGLFRYNATADLVNRSLSLYLPCSLSYNFDKLPFKFDGGFRIDFWAIPLPKKSNKLAEAAVALEEKAKKFEEQRKQNQPQEEEEADNKEDTDEIDLNDDRNLNLSLDFLHDNSRQQYSYYNTFGVNGCCSFEFMDIATMKLKMGIESKLIEPDEEEPKDSENPANNEPLIEEEEEFLEEGNQEAQQQEQPAEDYLPNVKTVFRYKASLEGSIAQTINFSIASDDDMSTHAISFPIPYSNFSFGLCTSILNGKKGLNTIGTSLVYNSEDGLSRIGFAYDIEYGKDNDSKSWNFKGGVLQTQFSHIIHANFHKDDDKKKLAWNKKESAPANTDSFWATKFERFRQYLKSFRHNLRDVDTFYLGSSLKFDFSSNNTGSQLFTEGSLGVLCNLPESIAKNAQFQVLSKVSQIEDSMSEKSSYDFSLSARYSWLVADKTNLSLYSKVSTSSLLPSIGVKLVYKE